MNVDRIGQPLTTTARIGEWTFTGASVSAYTTFVYSPELKVIFDMGSVVEEMLPIEHVFITHGHQDHLLGLSRYVGLRRLQHMQPPTVFLPSEIVERVKRLLACWRDIEGEGRRKPPMVELVGVKGGDEYPIRGNLHIQPFKVQHTLPSVGYTLIQRTRKLRPEYYGTPGYELAAMKERGIEITNTIDRRLVMFIGDTVPETLDTVDLSTSEIVFVECTFLEPNHLELAEARGHLHIRHLVERIECFGDAKIVLTHFSRRYGRSDIESLVRTQWPDEHAERLTLLV